MEIFIIMKHPVFNVQKSLVERKFTGKEQIFLMYRKFSMMYHICEKMNVAKLSLSLELVTSLLSPMAGPPLVVPGGPYWGPNLSLFLSYTWSRELFFYNSKTPSRINLFFCSLNSLSPGGGPSLVVPYWGPNLSLFLFYIS